jgi:hypothetical protein
MALVEAEAIELGRVLGNDLSGLPQDIIDGILPEGLGSLDEWPSETHLSFDFLGSYIVLGNVTHPVIRPKQLMNFHAPARSVRYAHDQRSSPYCT